ncbi:MAG: ChaN family lipoprotein [Aridibacter sp.]
MNKIFILFLLLFTMTFSAFAQNYRIFDGKGNPSDLDKILETVGKSDVVFLGEQHDDSVAHKLQFEIFKSAVEKYGADRKPALSLEMFERDVQTVLDEYLQDLITEKHFLASSRPWNNYETDYRPLVEFAKEKNLPVIAANAPRRYVNMVSRLSKNSLERLSPEAKKWLAPTPFPASSKTYSDKFNALMGGHGSSNILASQTLWDATMAHSIAENLKKDSLIIHLNGSFHTENRLGTVEQLLKYKPKTRILVVTMRYENDFQNFDPGKHINLGDFVILTDAKLTRSSK